MSRLPRPPTVEYLELFPNSLDMYTDAQPHFLGLPGTPSLMHTLGDHASASGEIAAPPQQTSDPHATRQLTPTELESSQEHQPAPVSVHSSVPAAQPDPAEDARNNNPPSRTCGCVCMLVCHHMFVLGGFHHRIVYSPTQAHPLGRKTRKRILNQLTFPRHNKTHNHAMLVLGMLHLLGDGIRPAP
jgi:hypothetical protein